MNLQWFCLNPLAILIVESLLSNLTDVDFWIEISGEGMVMIASITVYDVEIMHLVEMMLCSISCVNTRHTRVETTTKNRC